MNLYSSSNPALCFDDILLVPKISTIYSRSDVNLNMSIGQHERAIELYLPLIASPMDTVCEAEMAMEMARHGGLGIIHRYMTPEKQSSEVLRVAKAGFTVGAAVPTSNGKSVLPRVESLIFSGAKVILVDTANGHNTFAVETVREIRKAFPRTHIMAGNVATAAGFMALALAGADSVRVGIGGGSCCTTRIVSGHGLPTLASIMEIYDFSERSGLPTSIIADGGIRNSGDAVKAFAAGAEAVMLGSLLAGHTESPGKVFTENGVSFKKFRGMASKEAQKDWRGHHKSGAEGIETVVPFRGPVSNTLDEIRLGISSGCSYAGVGSLEDLSWNAEYSIVTHNSVKESIPHGIS
jgi:IMP dehydrogenase